MNLNSDSLEENKRSWRVHHQSWMFPVGNFAVLIDETQKDSLIGSIQKDLLVGSNQKGLVIGNLAALTD